MIHFSYRNFKDYLKKPLEKNEVRFLFRTFSRSCVYLFFFMLFIIGCGVVMFTVLQNSVNKDFVYISLLVASGLLALLSWFPKTFCYYRYQANPLKVTSLLVKASWVFLIIFYASSFLLIVSIVCLATKPGTKLEDFLRFLLTSGGSIFLTTIVAYSIPAFVAFKISRKTAISLCKFLWMCMIFYAVLTVLFVAFLILGSTKGWESFSPSLCVFYGLVGLVILFIAPVLTLYRLKTVVPYINYEDDFERGRWENFFVFEIFGQLLALALTITRCVLRALIRSN